MACHFQQTSLTVWVCVIWYFDLFVITVTQFVRTCYLWPGCILVILKIQVVTGSHHIVYEPTWSSVCCTLSDRLKVPEISVILQPGFVEFMFPLRKRAFVKVSAPHGPVVRFWSTQPRTTAMMADAQFGDKIVTDQRNHSYFGVWSSMILHEKCRFYLYEGNTLSQYTYVLLWLLTPTGH